MDKKRKVVILYRVVQHWRAPVFRRLCNNSEFDLNVFYGPDFEGSKVVSTRDLEGINAKRLPSFLLRMKATNGDIMMPVSYFLFFNLIYLNPDIVVSEGASNLVNAMQGFFYAKIFRKKFIWWSLGRLQNNKNDFKRKKLDFLIRYIERKSDAILTYSSVGRAYFESLGISGKDIFVAVNVVDTDSKQLIKDKYLLNAERRVKSESNFCILYVGAITKEKKLDLLLRSFKMLESKYSNVQLDIVGTGPEKHNMERLSKELNIKNFVFHGQVLEHVYEYFINADVFVMPGLGGLAISEAMVFGLPVIVSIGDGCEVDLVDKSNGFRDPDLNERRLYEYLDYLHDNPSRLNEMKRASIDKVKNKFNINTYIDQITACFHYVSQK